jgi:hypothetical protein
MAIALATWCPCSETLHNMTVGTVYREDGSEHNMTVGTVYREDGSEHNRF